MQLGVATGSRAHPGVVPMHCCSSTPRPGGSSSARSPLLAATRARQDSIFQQHPRRHTARVLLAGALPPATPPPPADDADDEPPLAQHHQHQQQHSSPLARAARALGHLRSAALYSYYNWRQGSVADLQLTTALTLLLLAAAAAARHLLLASGGAGSAPAADASAWADVYAAARWMMGQDFPAPGASSSGPPLQVLALLTGGAGLAAFALMLALMEASLLEALEANVTRGGDVHERGHLLLLGWAASQRDVEVLRRVLQQVCLAYAPHGGTAVVVLTARPKLEMEAEFRRCLPDARRHGSRLVFRQGSPLAPADLRRAAAPAARAVVVVSDQSIGGAEADAQALRAAILLDELDDPAAAWCVGGGGGAGGGGSAGAARRGASAAHASFDTCGSGESWDEGAAAAAAAATSFATAAAATTTPAAPPRSIVVELRTSAALPLLKFACSPRVVALPTAQLNAQRFAKMVSRPAISVVSQQLINYDDGCASYVHCFPQLAGARFADLARRFPRAIVLGIVSNGGGDGGVALAPPPDTVLQRGDCLVLVRPVSARADDVQPVPWDEDEDGDGDAAARGVGAGGAAAALPRWNNIVAAPTAAAAASGQPPPSPRQQPPPPRHIPVEYIAPAGAAPQTVVIAGLGPPDFMAGLLRQLDRGGGALAPGSQVLLVNAHEPGVALAALPLEGLENVTVRHVRADPLHRSQLSRALDLRALRAAIVLVDQAWLTANAAADDVHGGSGGGGAADAPGVLRLDALVMAAQLNLRKLLSGAGLPEINVIAQKVGTEGYTRFEDRRRPPLGISINLNSYAAKLLTQVAYDARMLPPLLRMADGADLELLDASELAAAGEAASFWTLASRAQAGGGGGGGFTAADAGVSPSDSHPEPPASGGGARAQRGDVLIGFYRVADDPEQPLEVVVNPLGDAERHAPRVWNRGDGRLKLVVLRAVGGGAGRRRGGGGSAASAALLAASYAGSMASGSIDFASSGAGGPAAAAATGGSAGSLDELELETTQRAQWVARPRPRPAPRGGGGGNGGGAAAAGGGGPRDRRGV